MKKNHKQIKNKKKFLGIFIPCATLFSAAVAGVPALVLCTYHHLTMPYKDQRWVDIDESKDPCSQEITYHMYLNESLGSGASLLCSVKNHPFNNDKFKANIVNEEPVFIDDKHFTIGVQLSPMEEDYTPKLLDCANFDIHFKYIENDKIQWEDNIFNLRIRWGKADW